MTPSAQELCHVPKTKENILNIDYTVLMFSDIGARYADNTVVCANKAILSILVFFRDVKMHGEKLLLHPVQGTIKPTAR